MMVRKILLMTAAVTSFCAVVNGVFALNNPEGDALWNASRVLATLFILVVGALTVRYLLTGKAGAGILHLLPVAAFVLIALGIFGTGLAIYFGRTTGDFEYYLFPIHWLFVIQGVLTLWHIRSLGHPFVRQL